MQLRRALAGLSLLVLSAAGASAGTMPCATPQNLLQNCSFEDETWWQTGGNWDAYDAISSPGAQPAHTGGYSLKLGSDPTQNVPGVWNYIDDQAGVDYTLTFWLHTSADDNQGGDLQFFAVEFGGQFIYQMRNQPASDPNNWWEMFTFTVTGGGVTAQHPYGDFFAIEGYSEHGYIYVDDVSLSETSADSSAPEPGTLGLLLSGLVGLTALLYRHRPFDQTLQRPCANRPPVSTRPSGDSTADRIGFSQQGCPFGFSVWSHLADTMTGCWFVAAVDLNRTSCATSGRARRSQRADRPSIDRLFTKGPGSGGFASSPRSRRNPATRGATSGPPARSE